ncbi:MAG: M24 family metallopeptidase [Thermoplasmata archaeon]|nr:MAG: M24 family metallopeptidase [Thermoplasmata archaeon]
MRRRSVFMVILVLLFIIFSNAIIVNAYGDSPEKIEPDIVKNQFLLESARIADMGMETAKITLQRAFYESITEADVVRAINDAMTENGSSEYVEAFGVIVASGEQSALPHGDDSDDEVNLILRGEVVVVDLGARYMGYCSDLTRTFFMGCPTQEMIEIYNITLEAEAAGIEAVGAGVRARDVDKAARDIISSYGYGENFIHALGHGIGLYIHMPPTLSPSSNEILFESGDMCLTIEPGIYLEKKFGVRIEDDVFVKRSGYELLTYYPKDLESVILRPSNHSEETADMGENLGEEGSGVNNLLVLGVVFLVVVVGIVVVRKRGIKIL